MRIQEFSWRVGALCHAALLAEVDATPKPGLVDCRNSGAHTDMGRALFYKSADALREYYRDVAAAGARTAALPHGEAFAALRPLGVRAEEAMFAATHGVNTHKGAIFTLGLVAAAAGRLAAATIVAPAASPAAIIPQGAAAMPQRAATLTAEALCGEVAAYTAGISGRELSKDAPGTKGVRAYLAYGARGVRGEAEAGLPGALGAGLPAYRAALHGGCADNDALLYALLHILASVEDTNILTRHDETAAAYARQQAAALLGAATLAGGPPGSPPGRALGSPAGAAVGSVEWKKRLEELDDDFIRRNISPGGCADLLAATWLLHRLGEAHPPGYA